MSSDTIENILILQGGGSLGAFGCGVFKALTNKLAYSLHLLSNILLIFSLFCKFISIKRLHLYLNSSVTACTSFWCTTTITFLSTLSKSFTESMNSFDLSCIGPISSQMIMSEFFTASFNRSAAKRHPSKLTKYFPTLGPRPVTDAKTLLSSVLRSMNSNPILILLVLSSLETMPPTFTPLSFNNHANRIMVVVLPTCGAPVRTIIVVILLFLIGRGSRSRIHSTTIASYVILRNFYLESLVERFDIRSVPFNDLIQKHCAQILIE